MKLDNSSVKIVAKSPKPSTPKLQCKLDAWVKKCWEVGIRLECLGVGHEWLD